MFLQRNMTSYLLGFKLLVLLFSCDKLLSCLSSVYESYVSFFQMAASIQVREYFSLFLVTCLSFIQSLCIISSHTYVQLRSTAQDCWSLNFFDLLLLLSTFSFRIHVCCMDYEMHFTMVDVSLWSQLYSASDVRFQSQCRMFLELFSSLKFCYTSCNLVFVVFRVCLCFMHST